MAEQPPLQSCQQEKKAKLSYAHHYVSRDPEFDFAHTMRLNQTLSFI